MTTREVVKHSDDSISWRAHREAERLDDESLIDELAALVSTSKSKEERKAAYFVLGSLGVNRNPHRAAGILVSRADSETDKYVLTSLLDSLANLELPPELPLAPIFRLLREPRWLVRHTALRSLRKAASESAKEQILAHLKETGDPYDKIYCHATLNQIGTPRSISEISRSLTSRQRDVKHSAEAAIAAIQSRHSRSARGETRPIG